jgi:predicted MFS family arabinose efflux permease
MCNNKNLALLLMLIVVGLLNADQNIINSMLGPIEAEFHVNDADIGFMSGLFTLVGAVISLIWGYLSDKHNRKNLFAFTVLIGQVPCLLTAFVTNYTQFFWLRILTGIGVGASFPVVFSMLGDLYDEKRRTMAVTWMTTVIGLGQILGQLFGGYLGPVYGWRFPFLVTSIPNLLILILFYILVAEPKRGAGEAELSQMIAEGQLYTKTIKFSDYLNLVKVKTNVYLFLQGIAGTIPWGAIPLFLVKFLSESKSLTIEQATTTFLLFAVGNVLGTIFGGIAGGKLFSKKSSYLPQFCAVTTLIGTAITLYLFLWLPAGELLATGLLGFAASFFVSMTGPNMRAMLLDTNVPENRGAIFSIFNLTDSVGTGIGKFVAGVLSVMFGLNTAISISAAFWIPCAILLWIVAAIFPKDIMKMHEKISKVAVELKGTESA